MARFPTTNHAGSKSVGTHQPGVAGAFKAKHPESVQGRAPDMRDDEPMLYSPGTPRGATLAAASAAGTNQQAPAQASLLNGGGKTSGQTNYGKTK
jgi:hypothetical protein